MFIHYKLRDPLFNSSIITKLEILVFFYALLNVFDRFFCFVYFEFGSIIVFVAAQFKITSRFPLLE